MADEQNTPTDQIGGVDYKDLHLVRVQHGLDGARVENGALVLNRSGSGRADDMNTTHFSINAVVGDHVFHNGLDSSSGKAVLMVINLSTGAIDKIGHHATGAQRMVSMVHRDCFTVAPFAGHYEPLMECGDAVKKGDAVGLLHDFERIDLPPWPEIGRAHV